MFLLDFFVKNYIKDNFYLFPLPVIQDFFHITLVFNKGAAFGILSGFSEILIYSSAACIILFIFLFRNEVKRSLYAQISLGFIVGGALSNLIDRIRFGYVIDYLDFRVWPVFNISDAFITLGAAIFFIDSFRRKNDNKIPRKTDR